MKLTDVTDAAGSTGSSEGSAPASSCAASFRFAVIIPAYRPEESLVQLIGALSEKAIPAIVLVDDGSGADYRDIFHRAAEFARVRLVSHAVNLGKGAALKTGINYAMCAFPDLQGVVTADADGQHHPDDIAQVAESLAAEPDRVILGARTFDGGVPLRSRIGNAATRAVMRVVAGQQISDTQTGLRGIPARLLPSLLRLEANGYDFELDVLIAVREQAVRVVEVPIRTIYEPGNRTSHFNPLVDSMKIYFVLLRFSSVSLMTAALDTLVFYLAYRRLGNLAASQALGRLLAVAFNYSLVRRAVFVSKLRHASVLPQYLLLVCLSGIASYAGIQLLNSRFQIQPLPAKLLVETLLFFANFAIQRDFIFGKSPTPVRPKRPRPPWVDTLLIRLPRAALIAAVLLTAGILWYGLGAEGLRNQGWTKVGWQRLLHYTWVYGAVSSAIVLIAPEVFAPVIAGLVVVATVAALGPLAVLAVAAFLISASAVGSKLLGPGADSSPDSQVCATLLGISVYIFVMTCIARLPMNYPAVYATLLLIPVILDIRGVWRRLGSWTTALVRSRSRPRRQVAAFALLAFVLGMHWILVPQPEVSADGLAMHLAIPVNIAVHHAFSYQPSRIFWSVMPMGADWCFSMVYLLGGEYAARLLNFTVLLLVVALLYRAARRFVSPATGFIIAALFASTSLVQLVTGSLFVENFLAVMVFGMAAAIWQFGDSGDRRYLFAAAALGGTALAIKLGGLAYVAVALPVMAIEVRRQWGRMGRRPWLTCAAAIFFMLAAALPTYWISWRMTGDPVYPFLNQTFPSPLVDSAVTFRDYHFKQPLTFRTLYDLTFHTDRYFEGRPGSLGFHYLLLAPIGWIALLAVRRRPAVSAAAVSLGGALIVLTFLPNARYLYPSLPLLLVPLAALFGWLAPGRLRRALIGFALAFVVLNTVYLPASNYYHGNFYEQAPLSRGMRQAYIHNNAPMREIGQYMNRQHPGSAIFLADGSDLAAFNAEAYSIGWHQYGVYARLQLARSPREIYRLLDEWKVHYIAAPKPGYGVTINPRTLQDLIGQCTTPEYQANYVYLARLEESCRQGGLAPHQPILVQPGVYDDFDPAIAFDGPWIQDQGWPQTQSHTVTYATLPGSQIRFAFEGGLLTYVYTKSANRGMADIAIDGVHQAPLDLYSAEVRWQTRTNFKLNRGRHLAVVTILPDKNPKSSDRFVDLDAFKVQ